MHLKEVAVINQARDHDPGVHRPGAVLGDQRGQRLVQGLVDCGGKLVQRLLGIVPRQKAQQALHELDRMMSSSARKWTLPLTVACIDALPTSSIVTVLPVTALITRGQ